MAFDLTALTDYTEEKRAEIIAKSVLGSRFVQEYTNPFVGIKSAEKITDLSTDATFQAGGSCGFNASGTTTLSQRTLTVSKIKIQEAICPDELEAKWTQAQVQAGSELDSFDFLNIYTEQKMKETQKEVERQMFQGDTGGSDLIDGYLTLITADAYSSVIDGNPTAITAGTGITAANVVGIIDGIYELIPEEVLMREDMVIHVGWDVFRTYTIALKDDNLFHYSPDMQANGVLTIPGTNIRMVAFNGMNGTNRIFATYTANLLSGHDLLNEYEDFSIRYSEDNEEVRYSNKFKLGGQIAFLEFVVDFTLA